MELRHLRYFLAVADLGHFTRASETLHVSQPTLSQQIRQLEEELGTLLFDRIGKRVQLTAAGEVFRGHARRALREMADARAAIDELAGLQRGSVTVGVVQTVNVYLIPNAIARFTSIYPAIKVSIRELAAGEIDAGLIGGELELGIGFTPPSSEEIEAEPLFDEDLVLIVPPGHRLHSRQRIRTRDLAEEPLVLLAKNFCTRRLVDECLQTASVNPRVVAEMNAIEGILATVRTSGAATILPRLALRGHPELRGLKLTGPSLRRSVGLLWRRNRFRCAASRAFAETISITLLDVIFAKPQPVSPAGAEQRRVDATNRSR